VTFTAASPLQDGCCLLVHIDNCTIAAVRNLWFEVRSLKFAVAARRVSLINQ
jgi:hypothetical protein